MPEVHAQTYPLRTPHLDEAQGQKIIFHCARKPGQQHVVTPRNADREVLRGNSPSYSSLLATEPPRLQLRSGSEKSIRTTCEHIGSLLLMWEGHGGTQITAPNLVLNRLHLRKRASTLMRIVGIHLSFLLSTNSSVCHLCKCMS